MKKRIWVDLFESKIYVDGEEALLPFHTGCIYDSLLVDEGVYFINKGRLYFYDGESNPIYLGYDFEYLILGKKGSIHAYKRDLSVYTVNDKEAEFNVFRTLANGFRSVATYTKQVLTPH